MTRKKTILQSSFRHISPLRSGLGTERYQIRRVALCEPEEDGPVQSVEAEEDDGEGHAGHPLYVTVPHSAQGRGGGQGKVGSINLM